MHDYIARVKRDMERRKKRQTESRNKAIAVATGGLGMLSILGMVLVKFRE